MYCKLPTVLKYKVGSSIELESKDDTLEVVDMGLLTGLQSSMLVLRSKSVIYFVGIRLNPKRFVDSESPRKNVNHRET